MRSVTVVAGPLAAAMHFILPWAVFRNAAELSGAITRQEGNRRECH